MSSLIVWSNVCFCSPQVELETRLAVALEQRDFATCATLQAELASTDAVLAAMPTLETLVAYLTAAEGALETALATRDFQCCVDLQKGVTDLKAMYPGTSRGVFLIAAVLFPVFGSLELWPRTSSPLFLPGVYDVRKSGFP